MLESTDIMTNLPLQGLQAMQTHFDRYHNHHANNIAKVGASNYFVKPMRKMKFDYAMNI